MRARYILSLFPLLAACVGGLPDKDSGDGGTGSDSTDGGGGGGGETTDDGCLTDTPTLRIGTGESEWLPLEPGDSLMMIHGPQDGWHMLGSALVEGTEPIVELFYDIFHVESGELVASTSFRVALVETGDCVGFYPGMFGVLTPAAGDAPDVLSYETLRLEMTAIDLAGRTASASLEVLAVPDPVDIN